MIVPANQYKIMSTGHETSQLKFSPPFSFEKDHFPETYSKTK